MPGGDSIDDYTSIGDPNFGAGEVGGGVSLDDLRSIEYDQPIGPYRDGLGVQPEEPDTEIATLDLDAINAELEREQRDPARDIVVPGNVPGGSDPIDYSKLGGAAIGAGAEITKALGGFLAADRDSERKKDLGLASLEAAREKNEADRAERDRIRDADRAERDKIREAVERGIVPPKQQPQKGDTTVPLSDEQPPPRKKSTEAVINDTADAVRAALRKQ